MMTKAGRGVRRDVLKYLSATFPISCSLRSHNLSWQTFTYYVREGGGGMLIVVKNCCGGGGKAYECCTGECDQTDCNCVSISKDFEPLAGAVSRPNPEEKEQWKEFPSFSIFLKSLIVLIPFLLFSSSLIWWHPLGCVLQLPPV